MSAPSSYQSSGKISWGAWRWWWSSLFFLLKDFYLFKDRYLGDWLQRKTDLDPLVGLQNLILNSQSQVKVNLHDHLNHLKGNSRQGFNVEESSVKLPRRFEPFDRNIAAQVSSSRQEMRGRAISRGTLVKCSPRWPRRQCTYYVRTWQPSVEKSPSLQVIGWRGGRQFERSHVSLLLFSIAHFAAWVGDIQFMRWKL